jgi:hypothetical protein
LLKQLEELISEEGLDEAQPIEEAEATQNQLPPTAKSEQESSPIESGLDSLGSQKEVTKEFKSESSLPPPRTPEVPDEQETLSSESVEEFQPDAKDEPIHKGSEFTESLTDAEMASRLRVKTSTLGKAKKRTDFSEWSQSKDPEGIAWQWVPESKCFLSLEN